MEELTDQSPMPFGKYLDEPMEKVPAAYLLWVRDNVKNQPAVHRYIESNLVALCKECPDYINERKRT